MSWSVELIAEAEKEFRALPEDLKGSFLFIGRLMAELGPTGVGMPYVRHLDGKLWEMRLKGKGGIARAVYFSASGRRVVVVRIFAKKTEKTPRREIDLARKRMRSFDD